MTGAGGDGGRGVVRVGSGVLELLGTEILLYCQVLIWRYRW